MARRRTPTSNPVDLAEDVLAGRSEPDARTIIELVHAINPTGREVNDRDRARRYELKSKLQSFLVRKFGDELVVTAESRGVVSLAHRYLGRDACHAQLDSLDADARSWVQWRLDTGDDAEPKPSRSGSHRAVASTTPLERGKQALAEYDYDAAQAAFREALDSSPDDTSAARSLLELLVDLLAQDEDALALVDRLPRDALADVDVRSLLALAAARSGDARRARRWLADIANPRAAEAWIVLARGALATDAFDDVERSLREAETCDAANPAIVEVRTAAAARRRDLRQPDESRLEALAATSDDQTLRTHAREVLARWPDSVVAAKLLSAIDQRERKQEAARLRVASEAALAANDLPRARELADRAAHLGEDMQTILAQINRAGAAAREHRDATQVAHVTALLDTDRRSAVAAYLALEPALRDRVRSASQLPVLGWLDTLAATRSRSNQILAAVEAFDHAREADARGDRVAALRFLEEHELLVELREARQLRDRLREALAAERQQTRSALLAEALAAWTSRDVETASRLLDQIDARALDPDSRARATQLGESLRRHRVHAERLVRIDALVAEGRALEARVEIDRALRDVADADPADLTQRLTSVRDTIRATTRVQHASSGPLDLFRLGAAIGPLPFSAQPEPWVTPSGEVVLAVTRDRLLIIATLDVERDRIEMLSLVTPEPVGPIASAYVEGDRLWLASQRWFLEVELRRGELCCWSSLVGFVPPNHSVENVFIVPDESVLWLETMDRGSDSRLQLIDLHTWRVIRTPVASRFLFQVPGQPSVLARLDYDAGATLHTGRGRLAGELLQLANCRTSSMIRHPVEDGWIAATSEGDDDGDNIVLVELIGGRKRHELVLPDTDPDRIFSLIGARSNQHLFAFHYTPEAIQLMAIRPTADEMTIVYREPAPKGVLLVHDVACERVVALWDAHDIGIAQLGPTPPALSIAPHLDSIPSFEYPFPCSALGEPKLLEPVEHAVRDADWSRALDLLVAIDVDSLPESHRHHFHHLHGLALARTGDLAAAARAWEAGRELPFEQERLFPCPFDACLALLADLPDPLPDEWWDVTAPPLQQLRGAIATADACRARGDLAGALAALRRRVVFRTLELQSLARLVDLMLVPELPVDEFEKTCVLAALVDTWSSARFRELPIPGAWNAERLEGLALEARRSLRW